MTEKIESVRKLRSFLLKQISGLTTEQLNKIPPGFSNNIAWNLGHLVAAQQGICYVRSSLQPAVDADILDRYKTGTRPESFIAPTETDEIRSLLYTTLDRLIVDYKEQAFVQYTEWTTRYDVTISSIDDAVQFLLFHEGFHMGVVSSIQKVV